MHHLAFVFALLLTTVAWGQPPNVLLVIADDLGLDPVPGYLPGPQKATMPHLEALMAQGLTFDNVWADPLCSPTRSTILTGRYGYRTGVLNPGNLSLLPATETTLHRYLTDNGSGYASCIIGKWHLGGLQPDANYPNAMGIPHYAGLLAGAVNSYYQWPLTVDGTTTPSTDYITTAITDRAIDWIAQQASPWFCWLAYTAPHSPFHLPPTDLHTFGTLPTDQASIDADPLPYFLAMTESVDHELGRLLGALPPDVRANTVVLFIGDNGTEADVVQAPYTAARAKGTLYEGGVHVPLVIAGPGITRAGEREAALVNTTDLFPTIVELTGATLPLYEDGYSLVPLFTQTGTAQRTCLYTEVEDTQVGNAVRDARWKLIRFSNGQQRFYDLLNDPWESTNLFVGGLTTTEQEALAALTAQCTLSTSLTAVPAAPAPTLVVNENGTQLRLEGAAALAVRVEVRNALGALVLAVDGAGTVDLQSLVPGTYVAHLQQGDQWLTRRFVRW